MGYLLSVNITSRAQINRAWEDKEPFNEKAKCFLWQDFPSGFLLIPRAQNHKYSNYFSGK